MSKQNKNNKQTATTTQPNAETLQVNANVNAESNVENKENAVNIVKAIDATTKKQSNGFTIPNVLPQFITKEERIESITIKLNSDFQVKKEKIEKETLEAIEKLPNDKRKNLAARAIQSDGEKRISALELAMSYRIEELEKEIQESEESPNESLQALINKGTSLRGVLCCLLPQSLIVNDDSLVHPLFLNVLDLPLKDLLKREKSESKKTSNGNSDNKADDEQVGTARMHINALFLKNVIGYDDKPGHHTKGQLVKHLKSYFNFENIEAMEEALESMQEEGIIASEGERRSKHYFLA